MRPSPHQLAVSMMSRQQSLSPSPSLDAPVSVQSLTAASFPRRMRPGSTQVLLTAASFLNSTRLESTPVLQRAAVSQQQAELMTTSRSPDASTAASRASAESFPADTPELAA
jgi:hypothetical protein